MKVMEILTKVDSPNPKASTLRTIIPREAINILDLKKGDNIKWSFHAKGENKPLEIILEKEE